MALAVCLFIGWVLWLHYNIISNVSISFDKPVIAPDNPDPAKSLGVRILMKMNIGNNGSLDMDVLDGTYTISVNDMTSEGISDSHGTVKAYTAEMEPIHLSPGSLMSFSHSLFITWDSLMEANATGVMQDYFWQRREPYDHLGLIIEGSMTIQASFYKMTYPFHIRFDYGPVQYSYPQLEQIRIKDTYVVRNGNNYIVIINFINTGTVATGIDTIFLNGLPYNAVGWSGEIVLSGNFSQLPSFCDVGVEKEGIIEFGQGIKDPNGNMLSSGVTLDITLHTTSGNDFPATVILP